MKCPHCLENFHDKDHWTDLGMANDRDGYWQAYFIKCPSCDRLIVNLLMSDKLGRKTLIRARPKGMSRSPLPPDVPEKYSQDYIEACLVLPDSPKASAALSRRCLQHVLRGEAKVKASSLDKEIQEVLDSGRLPSYLAEAIDGVRNIGNFAAHPMKSTNTGEVADVEPGEAEWLLDTIEALFDFYIVLPPANRRKRDALNKKLQDLNKPPMK